MQIDAVPMFRSLSCLSLAFSLSLAASTQAADKPRQLLIISFDGAHDNAPWVKSRAMAERAGAHFTYFLSCTFLMTKDVRKTYQVPGHKPGRSNVGFAMNDEEIRIRADHIWQAHLEGHEIGSHGCGHFDGKDWTKADWSAEFATFSATLKNVWTSIGQKEPDGWQDFVAKNIRGFRAPYLSVSAGMLAAEKQAGYTFDASAITKGPALPVETGGMLQFGLPLIPEGPQQKPVIGMDYNLFVRHSVGVETKARSAEFEERTYSAFKTAFDQQYDGHRIPLQLGFHFVEMNGGAYWRALDRLVTEVCHRADVGCVTYPEAMAEIGQRQAVAKADGSAF